MPHKTVLENAATALKVHGIDQTTREAAATLQSIITLAARRTDATVNVTDAGEVVGSVDMRDLLAALVPYKSERAAPSHQS